ncbi:TetR/AcrR family transcriptional regulator [Nannocystis sp. ILAH1]|uniref:TetR/AcrR family transcriptional regulator n=1 Tax=unclassified Nannocystis TaxID=2627009 RepID=UPI00226D6000|nr:MULTISPECIES: TetR/AcrR family transcriptional regulator [unclassified Nannocystis]MCY0990018.1 TetR/AcrR family transcriptional regulator [Nannocystis sp. ILAH1]MCY1066800.1 TetR/AcrR family transcriptional regulator [Nannocystis sp. RBIL2]
MAQSGTYPAGDLGNPRRAQILDAAERLLHHYGHAKTTVAEIAREARVSVGSVYLEFEAKDAIWVELSHRRHEAVLAAMRGAANAPKKLYAHRLQAALVARTRAFLALAERGAHAAELVHCHACPAIREAQEIYHRREREIIAELLQAGADAGEFAIKDASATAAALLQAFVAFVPPLLFGRAPDELEREVTALHQLLVHGLCRADPRPRS